MQTKTIQGQFEVIDSFAIKRRKEFYLIGELKNGTVQENWFVNVAVNKSFSITVRISSIEEVEIASETKTYQLLIVTGDEDDLSLLLGLNIGSELVDITIEGED